MNVFNSVKGRAVLSGLVSLFAAVVLVPSAAHAAIGYALSAAQASPVNEWGTCFVVTNNSGKGLFVPTNSAAEWSAFYNHLPAGVTTGSCGCSASGACGATANGGTCSTNAASAVTYPTTCAANVTSTCTNGTWVPAPNAYASCTQNYTYAWSQGGFGACSNSCGSGTQSQTVVCQRNDGATVADANCTGTKPATSQSCTSSSGCVHAQGSACSLTSASNSCGQTNTNTGTWSYDSCTAATPSVPANPAGYGNACTSSANSCGQTNTGTIQCNGSCSASTPSNPAGYGNACTSSANSCGQTNSGTITCSGSCSAGTPSNPAGYGNACTSSANSCGQTNPGYIQCNGSCSASTPSNATCGCSASGACGSAGPGGTCSSNSTQSVNYPSSCPSNFTSTCTNGSWSPSPGSYGSCQVLHSYGWYIGSWGSCSAQCGGTQSRTVYCVRDDGVQETGGICTMQLPPASTQSCNGDGTSCSTCNGAGCNYGSCSGTSCTALYPYFCWSSPGGCIYGTTAGSPAGTNVCNAQDPSYYGTSCSATSPANDCGDTQTCTGTNNCANQCSASPCAAPANSCTFSWQTTSTSCDNSPGSWSGYPAGSSCGYPSNQFQLSCGTVTANMVCVRSNDGAQVNSSLCGPQPNSTGPCDCICENIYL